MRQRFSYKHWFGEINLPAEAKQEECIVLYPAVRLGNQSAILRAIEGHLRLGCSIVCEFASDQRRTDDFVSVMCESLVVGVNLISKGSIDHHTTPNMTAYLATTIRGRIRKFIAKDGVFRVNPATFKKLSGKIPQVENSLDTYSDTLVVNCEYYESSLKGLSNQEERILNLRLEGYEYREIAPIVGLSFQRVGQIIKDIGNKYLESCNGRND